MLVGSLLIIKLLKQLIKWGGGSQIGYRLQLMYAAYGGVARDPALLETACMPGRSSL